MLQKFHLDIAKMDRVLQGEGWAWVPTTNAGAGVGGGMRGVRRDVDARAAQDATSGRTSGRWAYHISNGE